MSDCKESIRHQSQKQNFISSEKSPMLNVEAKKEELQYPMSLPSTLIIMTIF
jgi:hypothetical protein